MAGRPWYIQTADLTHRVIVLGIIGFSGYLSYLTVKSVQFNAQNKALRRSRESAAAAVEGGQKSETPVPESK